MPSNKAHKAHKGPKGWHPWEDQFPIEIQISEKWRLG